ncbi:MAG: hypothetical protein QGF09_11780, partial [Rhodospirillales bacterium]|nr:hypothetical protein [Rhodospirillales bacterium]
EGLQHHPDNEKIQLGFVSLIRSLRIELPDNIAAPERKQYVDLVGGALGRALAGNWLSANVLAKPACYLVLADPEIGPLPDLGGFEDLSADVAAAFLDN